MILTNRDNGRSLEANIGSLITVRLEENPSTGYRWAIDTKDDLEFESDHFEITKSAIGAAGERVFQFRASKVGSHRLLMKNWRAWEGDSSIIDRFSVTIFVK